jgi:hypothetical protein
MLALCGDDCRETTVVSSQIQILSVCSESGRVMTFLKPVLVLGWLLTTVCYLRVEQLAHYCRRQQYTRQPVGSRDKAARSLITLTRCVEFAAEDHPWMTMMPVIVQQHVIVQDGIPGPWLVFHRCGDKKGANSVGYDFTNGPMSNVVPHRI